MADQLQALSYWEKYKGMIPTTSKCMAIVLLVLNCIWPGLGTAIMACMVREFMVENLVIALLQFVLAICVIGWVWSIIWGVFVLMKAKPEETAGNHL
jgi:uncharacterized membrane protein